MDKTTGVKLQAMMADVVHLDETDDTGLDYNLDVFDDKENVTDSDDKIYDR